MSTELIIAIFSAIGVPSVLVIVWLIRLEGRVNFNEEMNKRTDKKVDTLTTKHEALDSKIVDKLTKVEVALAEIRGILKKADDHR